MDIQEIKDKMAKADRAVDNAQIRLCKTLRTSLLETGPRRVKVEPFDWVSFYCENGIEDENGNHIPINTAHVNGIRVVGDKKFCQVEVHLTFPDMDIVDYWCPLHDLPLNVETIIRFIVWEEGCDF